MSILETIEQQEKLLTRIKETIVPLQQNILWNDDTFFDEVKDAACEDLSEDKISQIVANTLSNLKIVQPKIEDVKKLISAFPGALECEIDGCNCLPIEYLTLYEEEEEEGDTWDTKYITTLALEGFKHNVGGENMRGGLLRVCCNGENTLQRLSSLSSDGLFLEVLKDLRRHKLVMKKDIVDFNLLLYCR